MGRLRSLSFAASCMVLSTISAWAAEPAPVGYVVSLAESGEEAEAAPETVTCRRAEQLLEAYDGFPVQAGDIVTSGKGRVLIAFLDESAVTLDKESSLKVEAYPYPGRRSPTTVSVESGSAYFSVTPRPDDAHFRVRMREHTIDVKGTSFKVYTQWDQAGNIYKSTVSVTQGNLTLRPNGASAVDIVDGTQVVLTSLNKNIAGFTGAETTISQKNLSRTEIKALEADCATKVEVTVGEKGTINIRSMCKNPDGSVITTSLTEVNGVRTKRVSVTKSGKAITEKVTENGTRATIIQTIQNLQLNAKLVGDSGTVTVKDTATRALYKGTITILPGLTRMSPGGRITDASSKDGRRIVIVEEYFADGSHQTSTTTFAAGATTGTQTTSTHHLDGSVTIMKEQVTTTWNGLDFVNVPGTTPEIGGGGLPPTRPDPSVFSTGNTFDVYDPSNPAPVSR